MTKPQRTLLFFCLFGAFIGIVPILILYSQGYRMDIHTLSVTHTGALFVKTAPPRADIFVDGEPAKRTDLLFGSAFIGNIFPGNHLVEIFKDGYQPWKKILPVTAKNVTEAKQVILFKDKISFQAVADNIERAWFSPDEKYALLKKKEPNKTWKATLVHLETRAEEFLFSQQNSKEDLLDITWASNSKRMLAKTSQGEALRYSVWGISKEDACFAAPCGKDALPKETGAVAFSPLSADTLLYTSFLGETQSLFETEYLPRESLENLSAPFKINRLANNVEAFTMQGDAVIWIDTEGKLWERNLAQTEEGRALPFSSIPLLKEEQKTLYAIQDAVLLMQKDTVSARSPLFPDMTFRASSLSPSPDGSSAIAATQHELLLVYLKKQEGQTPRKAGEITPLLKTNTLVKNIAWITPWHILFSAGSAVQIVETDARGAANVAKLTESPSPILYWKNSLSAFYLLSNESLTLSESLLP
ncbi:MAG: hypothetical protein HY482_01965 [Candidatus Wildermuthbacteria bacterium]|nr:hypothetical protein [Candidatus Wildermuthbacteria bacterium]